MSACAWNDHGVDCRHEGVISFGTNGGGPWYCREHADMHRGITPNAVGNTVQARATSRTIEERNQLWRWDGEQRRYVPRASEQRSKAA